MLSYPRLKYVIIASATVALLAIAFRAGIGGHSRPRIERANVLFILVDTLYAAHLGAYTPGLSNSPNIDALASSGVRFANSFSVSSWTKPTIASIFTSMLPSHHGLTRVRDRLQPSRKTMAEVFRDADFQTAGIASHIYLNESSGLPQGFERFVQLNQARGLHSAVTSDKVSDLAITWMNELSAAAPKKPFFLMLHYFDPHFRYIHHPEFDLTSGYKGALKPQMSVTALDKARPSFQPEDVEYLRNLYREEIAYTDQHIGRVLRHLKEAGLSESTLVVLTADHGEEFMEHNGLTHTNTLYDELLRIPLIFSLPGKLPSAIVSEAVDQLDILPTLQDLLLAAPRDPEWEGRSLAPLLFGEPSSFVSRDVISEVSYASVETPAKITVDMISVRSGPYKLIRDRLARRWLLFDMEQDPGERHNLASRRQDLIDAIAPKMQHLASLHDAQKEAPADGPQQENLRQDEVKKLKSLGYF